RRCEPAAAFQMAARPAHQSRAAGGILETDGRLGPLHTASTSDRKRRVQAQVHKGGHLDRGTSAALYRRRKARDRRNRDSVGVVQGFAARPLASLSFREPRMVTSGKKLGLPKAAIGSSTGREHPSPHAPACRASTGETPVNGPLGAPMTQNPV